MWIKTVKNKLDVPLRTVEIPLLFRGTGGEKSGFSDMWSVFYQLKRSKGIKVAGGRYSLDGMGDSFEMTDWPTLWGGADTMALIEAALVPWQNRIMQRDGAAIGEDEDDD